jgi:hypothetical protein
MALDMKSWISSVLVMALGKDNVYRFAGTGHWRWWLTLGVTWVSRTALEREQGTKRVLNWKAPCVMDVNTDVSMKGTVSGMKRRRSAGI